MSSSCTFRSPACPRRGALRTGIGDTDWQRSYSVPDYQPSQSEDVTQSEGKRPWLHSHGRHANVMISNNSVQSRTTASHQPSTTSHGAQSAPLANHPNSLHNEACTSLSTQLWSPGAYPGPSSPALPLRSAIPAWMWTSPQP